MCRFSMQGRCHVWTWLRVFTDVVLTCFALSRSTIFTFEIGRIIQPIVQGYSVSSVRKRQYNRVFTALPVSIAGVANKIAGGKTKNTAGNVFPPSKTTLAVLFCMKNTLPLSGRIECTQVINTASGGKTTSGQSVICASILHSA